MLAFQAFGPKKRSVPTLVLLHGWGGEWRSWFPIIERFKKTHRLLVPDLPGFGASPLLRAYSLEDYVTEVTRFLKLQKISSAVLIGHSFGGAIAAMIAAQEPTLVKKLILVDASGIRPHASIQKKMLGTIASSGRKVMELPVLSKAFPLLRKAFYSFGPMKNSDYAVLNSTVWKETFRNLISRDISNELVRIACPTLLIWGSEDADAPLSHGQRIHALIPQSNLVVFAGAGHFPYLDQTEKFEEGVRGFLR